MTELNLPEDKDMAIRLLRGEIVQLHWLLDVAVKHIGGMDRFHEAIRAAPDYPHVPPPSDAGRASP